MARRVGATGAGGVATDAVAAVDAVSDLVDAIPAGSVFFLLLGFCVVTALAYGVAFLANRCRDCGAFYSYVPTEEAEVVARRPREDEPDLVEVAQEYECRQCGATKIRNMNVMDGE